ncbi:PREDICTED: RNA pseudouridine synthase 3, mitochondrial [Lupinus angustifolius]|uniref:RNA pseudouridine synthase 3, mitochondrial n=1 Tax=Lupinus angustifolius TaxID=3871 RepID=UPI00092F8FEC|nr:PREDICTED: RNA pseudouridine synthase 3, mitochondrial [Lupinus angustifolius]
MTLIPSFRCRCSTMLSNNTNNSSTTWLLLFVVRHYSRIRPPKAVPVEKVIRVSNNIARLDAPKERPKPRQLLSLPPFPRDPLPGKNSSSVPGQPDRVTAVNWIKYYFKGMWASVIESHFGDGLVQMEELISNDSFTQKEGQKKPLRKIKPNEVMKHGARLHVPVSMAETRISKRYDAIPSGTLYPNADEIKYLQRLVIYKDSAIIVLNKPPKLPVKGNLPVHNSMDALAAAALSYDYDEGPKLVHRLDRETSGILLLGRTNDSVSHLQWLFSSINNAKSSSKAWNDACEATYQRYWALVIGTPKEKEGIIHAPLSKVLLDDGKTERVILANHSTIEPRQEAVTEYRVLGPKINGCSWIELRPLTYRKHQLRVHCAEALGTPIVGDYKYGWFVHSRWKQMPRVDIEPTTGKPYKLRRPEGLDVQKGSVLSKVPLLHLHCRELVLPNISKFLHVFQKSSEELHPSLSMQPDVLRFVATMPSHMRISWNLMSSYLI